ncbi:MAG: hypothetical protein PHC51_07890 [bacterium]|nr:hypothetical protein [bacterium]
MNKTIIILDDMLPFQVMTIVALENLGYDVLTAETGAQAEKLLHSYTVDLLIIDDVLKRGTNEAEDFINRLPEKLAYGRIAEDPGKLRYDQLGKFVWEKGDDLRKLIDEVKKVLD